MTDEELTKCSDVSLNTSKDFLLVLAGYFAGSNRDDDLVDLITEPHPTGPGFPDSVRVFLRRENRIAAAFFFPDRTACYSCFDLISCDPAKEEIKAFDLPMGLTDVARIFASHVGLNV